MLRDELVVCDVSNNRLQCFTLEGRYTRAIGRRGMAPGCFTLPTGVAATGGLLLVAEKWRIQVLTAEGVPLQVVTPPVCGSLQGLSCRGTRVLVADSEVRQVHEFEVNPVKLRALGDGAPHRNEAPF